MDSKAVQRRSRREPLCRSRRELSNEYLLFTLGAQFGFDTAENEPCTVCPLSAYRSLLLLLQIAQVIFGNGMVLMGRDNQILIGISAVSFSVGAFVLTTTYPKTDGKVGVRLYEGAVALAFMGTVVAMLTVLIGLWRMVPAYWLAFLLLCSLATIVLVQCPYHIST